MERELSAEQLAERWKLNATGWQWLRTRPKPRDSASQRCSSSSRLKGDFRKAVRNCFYGRSAFWPNRYAFPPRIGKSAEKAEFETASVKPTNRCSFTSSIYAAMVTYNGYPLKVILAEAFKVKMDQILGPS